MSQKCIIHKHVLKSDFVELELPEGTEILSAQEQCGEVVMWVLKTLGNKLQKRYFKLFVTGSPFDRSEYNWMMKHIDTIQLPTGIVLHLFEIEHPTEEMKKKL